MRRRLSRPLHFEGVGLHSGLASALTLEPAPWGAGYQVAFGDELYPLASAARQGDGRGTTLTFGPHQLMTVEHCLSALRGLGVDDVVLRPEGLEVPLLDGSALPFASALTGVLEEGEGESDWLCPTLPLACSSADGDKTLFALPWDGFKITYVIHYPGSALGTQMATLDVTPESYAAQVGLCRTFCLKREVEAMQRLGLAKGGSLDNAVVWDEEGPMNEGGLRCSDEAVRHKILDLIGDLALTGRRVRGHFVALRAGHALHLQMVDALMRSATA